MFDKVKDWVEAFDEAYMNAVIHGTGFIKVTTNGPGGLHFIPGAKPWLDGLSIFPRQGPTSLTTL